MRTWIRDNTGVDVWHVVNDHNYDDSHNVDRVEFLRLAKEAWAKVESLTVGYFRLEGSQFIQKGMEYSFTLPAKHEYWIEMEYYNRVWGSLGVGSDCLDGYKQWTKEFVEFAELLQDETLEYCCDN